MIRTRLAAWLVLVLAMAVGAVALAKAEQTKPASYKGLEVTVTGVERSSTVALRDCPPGANSIRGLTKPGEEFAIVNLSFKVTPAFKETIVKKPVLLDAIGRSLVRRYVTRRHLLEWTTAAQAKAIHDLDPTGFYRQMAGAMAIAILAGALTAVFKPGDQLIKRGPR